MLALLPEWLRERVAEQLDRIIHASTAVTVIFTGMSIEELALIIPALVSVTISILAWIAKRQDRKHKMEIYQREERARTEAMLKYLDSVADKADAAEAHKTINEVSKLGLEGANEKD